MLHVRMQRLSKPVGIEDGYRHGIRCFFDLLRTQFHLV